MSGRTNFLTNLIQYIASSPDRRSLPGSGQLNFYCGASASTPSASCPQSASAAPCPAPIQCPENVISLQDMSTKSRYTPADLNIIATTINKLLVSFCNDWGLQKYTIKLYPSTDTVSAFFKLYLKDVSDVPGANGYHTVASDGSAVGNIFIETIGASRLFADPAPLIKIDGIKRGISVPAVICHEVMEMLTNRYANAGVPASGPLNVQADPANGEVTNAITGNAVDIIAILSEQPQSAIWVPMESIDAVQSNLVEIAEQNKVIHLSDYVLPAWFSAPTQATASYNFLKNITKPFTIDIGGYTGFVYKDKLYYNIYFLQ
jgi:hypothetical protein